MSAPAILVLSVTLDELRALVRTEVRAALADHLPSQGAAELLDRHELARLLNVSAATIARLAKEGAPVTHVGQSPRYDVGAFRTWLADRGRRGTNAMSGRREVVPGVRLLSQSRGRP